MDWFRSIVSKVYGLVDQSYGNVLRSVWGLCLEAHQGASSPKNILCLMLYASSLRSGLHLRHHLTIWGIFKVFTPDEACALFTLHIGVPNPIDASCFKEKEEFQELKSFFLLKFFLHPMLQAIGIPQKSTRLGCPLDSPINFLRYLFP